MVQSSPPNLIAYGYSFSPLDYVPAATAEFARTFFPNMRFGLAVALMNDGFFTHDFGDFIGNGTEPVEWWYDEYDFALGQALGPARLFSPAPVPSSNLVVNGGFEAPLSNGWMLWFNTSVGAAASLTADSTTAAEGLRSARVQVSNGGQSIYDIQLRQSKFSLAANASYELRFQAKASAARTIGVGVGSNTANIFDLWQLVPIGTQWKEYRFSFPAADAIADAFVGFNLGQQTGDVWLDDVRIWQRPDDLWRRDFTGGAALLNGTNRWVTFNLEPGLLRFQGDQAPRYQYLVDDDVASFTATGPWKQTNYDTPLRASLPPFYHNWGGGSHRLDSGAAGSGEWKLDLPADGEYTLQAWWPAAPDIASWSKSVIYEVVANGRVLASAALDQSQTGDQWHTIAKVQLAAVDQPAVRIRNGGAGAIIADALHVFSTTRMNDGSPVSQVLLGPFDGILLRFGPPVLSADGVVSAASFAQGGVAPGEIVALFGSNLGPSAGVPNAGYDPVTGALPTTLGEVSVSFDGQAAPLFYVRSDQINVQVPYEVAGKSTTSIVVSYRGAARASVSVPVVAARPGIFGYNGRALVLNTMTGAVVDASHPISRGGWVTIYGTGPGLVDPPAATGKPAPLSPLSLARNPQAKIGGHDLLVDFAGMTPGLVGLLQINLQIPPDAPTGADVPLELSINGVPAQAYVGSAPTPALTIAIQ